MSGTGKPTETESRSAVAQGLAEVGDNTQWPNEPERSPRGGRNVLNLESADGCTNIQLLKIIDSCIENG